MSLLLRLPCLRRARHLSQAIAPAQARNLCATPPPGSGGGDDGSKKGDDEPPAPAAAGDELDDGFGLEGFLSGEDVEREEREAADAAAAKLRRALEDAEDVTPELASDLVNRMVQATSRTLAAQASPSGQVLDVLTPHTVSVLRAARVTTNKIQASASDMFTYPIEKRVTARLVLERLDLSPPALEALRILAGPRFDERLGFVALSCDRYPTKEENRAMIVTRMHRLVAAARTAVGEEVDETPLRSWQEVADEVQRQSDIEMEEAGSLSLVLGKTHA